MKRFASFILVVAFAILQYSLSAQDTFIYKMTAEKKILKTLGNEIDFSVVI